MLRRLKSVVMNDPDPDSQQETGLETHGEFDEPTTLTKAFCPQMSSGDFEIQAITETETALKELMVYLEKDPETYRQLLQKRKQDAIENSGVFSFLKAKVMRTIQGDSYRGDHVTQAECRDKLSHLKDEMNQAFNYAKDTKGVRFSKRLAARRGIHIQDENSPILSSSPISSPLRKKRKAVGTASPSYNLFSKTVAPPLVPPPPPVPMAKVMPLKDRNQQTPSTPKTIIQKECQPLSNHKPNIKLLSQPSSLKSWSSTSSIHSVHEELLASGKNPQSRLRTVCNKGYENKSPLTTRKAIKHDSVNSINKSYSNEAPLRKMFLSVMQKKFYNTRTPSPSMTTSPGQEQEQDNAFTP